ncbi:MAG: hypothetical protein ABSC26_13325 [Stellaceae bacterium]
MAEVNQYTLKHLELIELLIKHTDVHEGLWTLMLGIQVQPGNFGPNPEQTFPGMAMTVAQIGIQRHAVGAPTTGPGVIVVDAAKVNPKKKK